MVAFGACRSLLQMKDFCDLLKYLLNAPAVQIMREQVLGRISVRIEKIGDQRNIGFAGTLQCDCRT